MFARKIAIASTSVLLFACGDSEDEWDRWGTKNTWSENKTHVDVTVAPPSHFDVPRTVRCTCGGGRLVDDDTCAMIIGDDTGYGVQYDGLESATINGHVVIAWMKCDPRFKNYSVLIPVSEL